MEFRNCTRFPALAYEVFNQFGNEFHVVALRVTLSRRSALVRQIQGTDTSLINLFSKKEESKMASTMIVNGQTVVHKDSGGQVATVDVCLTPMGPSMVPIPYVNIAKSADTTDGSKKLDVDGNEIMLKDSKFSTSAGDDPGKAGVASGTVKGWAKFVNYSNDTFVEGKPVCRRLDPMISNNGNTAPAPLMQPNISVEEVEAKAAHSLSLGFVNKHPDAKGFCRQPVFDDGYTLSGPETFRGPEDSYTGGVHLSSTEGGEFKVKFDPFESEKE